jgi:hypothetical protein
MEMDNVPESPFHVREGELRVVVDYPSLNKKKHGKK